MSDALPTNETADIPISQDDTKMDITVETEMNGKSDANGNSTQITAIDEDMADQQQSEAGPALQESRIPAKKDATLREFLSKMDDCAPIIPDAVTNYYLTLAGLPPPPKTPLPLARLLALATQKFIADIAADAYQYSRIRASNTASNPMMAGIPAVGGPGVASQAGLAGGKETAAEKSEKGKSAGLGVQRPGFGGGGQGGSQGRTVLTMEDLGMAVGEYGINVRRGEFYR